MPLGLLIFTRYPTPGQTKTRLIPALGADGAADLHDRLVKATLTQVQTLPDHDTLSIQIWFTGSTLEAMQAWLGDRWAYYPQVGQDLGERIKTALADHFHRSDRPALVMGTDCPGLTPALVSQAYDHLGHCDLVIGPALDGGYYLLGVKRFIPDLFAHIAWGTETVFQQTLDIAQALALTYTCLPPLADIDRPEDLVLLKDYPDLA